MARRPERQGTGNGKHVGTSNGSITSRRNTDIHEAVTASSRDAAMAHDTKVGGNMHRNTTSGGSTPRSGRDAAMARSDGKAPRATNDQYGIVEGTFPSNQNKSRWQYAPQHNQRRQYAPNRMRRRYGPKRRQGASRHK
jgi:hypothetical protein